MGRLCRRLATIILALVVSLGIAIGPRHAAVAAPTLVVTTTANTAPPCPTSAYSLRCAISQANKDGSGDAITFNIPSGTSGCSAGVCTIQPSSALPVLTSSNTTIDGYTQPGAHPNTNSLGAGDNAIIRIRLDGARVGTGHVGIDLAGSRDTVEGLSVTGFLCTTYAGYCLSNGVNGTNGTNGDGIYIAGSTARNDVVQGDFIGVTPDGRTAGANSYGLVVDGPGASASTVGGTMPATANLISGNENDGLDLVSSGNTVSGNRIGTTAGGNAQLANTGFGVADLGTGPNIIGGSGSDAGNLISGNGGGVELVGPKGDVVAGNLIGTTATGTAALGNNLGIGVDYTIGANTIGGTGKGSGNIISGNTGTGVAISSANGTVIEGNFIGTNVTGTAALGNGYDGVSLSSQSSNNIIGGTADGAGNLISGNSSDGIAVSNLYHGTGNLIEGNHIGTTASGAAVPNAGNGVSFDQNWDTSTTDSGATVGGTAARAGNVIADNSQSGVLVGTAGVASIRVAITRNSIFANGGLGIDLAPQGTVNCTTSPPGPNDYTHCPVIQHATAAQVSGTACDGCSVDVFVSSPTADDQVHGEGKTFLGSTIASTTGSWSLALSPGQLTAGKVITATATTPGSSSTLPETSEFAANAQAGS